MIAALAVSTVLVTSTAVVVGTNYVTTQQSAQAALFDTLASGNEKVTAVTQRAADLELAITNAQNILKDSSGKVLDEASRQALEKSITQAQQTLKLQKAQLVKLKASVSSLKTPAPLDVLWPYGKQLRAQEVQDSDTTSVDVLVKAVMALGGGIQNVQAAQAAWQAEQDRIAAEQAAAEAAAAAQAAAAARRAAQAQSLQQSGGETAPTAPVAPIDNYWTTQIISESDIAPYVQALAANSTLVWIPGECTRIFGPNTYACGYATVNMYGTSSDVVPITLDSSLTQHYTTRSGLAVLVHEAAHA